MRKIKNQNQTIVHHTVCMYEYSIVHLVISERWRTGEAISYTGVYPSAVEICFSAGFVDRTGSRTSSRTGLRTGSRSALTASIYDGRSLAALSRKNAALLLACPEGRERSDPGFLPKRTTTGRWTCGAMACCNHSVCLGGLHRSAVPVKVSVGYIGYRTKIEFDIYR